MLQSPTKNGYATTDHLLEGLDDDTSDTLGDSIDDFINTKH